MHMQMTNNLMLILVLICAAVVLQSKNNSKKNKRRKLSNRRSRRMPADESDDEEIDLVLEKLAETMETMRRGFEEQTRLVAELVSCFKHEKERAKQRKNLYPLLKDVDGLTDRQRMEALVTIAKKPDLIDIVFSLAPEDRFGFVLDILKH